MDNNEIQILEQDDIFKWYVMFVTYDREFYIRDHIREKDNVRQYVKQILVPSIHKTIIRKNKKVDIPKIIFPNYVFILADLNDLLIKEIQDVGYVYHFLGINSNDVSAKPNHLTDKEVVGLRLSIFKSDSRGVQCEHFQINDYVCISEGIFRNLKGYVREIRKNFVIIDLENEDKPTSTAITINIKEIQKMV